MRLLAIVAAALALAGCAGESAPARHEPDVAAWKAELASIGIEPYDWDGYVETVQTSCDREDYGLYVSLTRGPGESLNSERVGLKHLCPDRLPDWDAAVVQLGEVQDRVDYICNTPREELSAEDRQEAEDICD